MTDGHFVPSDTGLKPVVDIVFSNVMHDWVGSDCIVGMTFSLRKRNKIEKYLIKEAA